MNKEYIQLPPLEKDTDSNLVRLLWEYARLPEKDQEATYKQYQILSKKDRTQEEIEEASIYQVDPDNIDSFLQSIRVVISELFHEAMGLSQYVYEECFVKGKDIEEILPDDEPRMQEALLSMYMLFMEDGFGKKDLLS